MNNKAMFYLGLISFCLGISLSIYSYKIYKNCNLECKIVDSDKESVFVFNNLSDDVRKWLNQNGSDIEALSISEIEKYNEIIISNTKTIIDIENYPNYLTKENLLSIIKSSNYPVLPKYNGYKVITEEDFKPILENQNISNIKSVNQIKKGLVTKRTSLRTLPTDLELYENSDDNEFDLLQESELHIGDALIIIHESLDKNWYFVETKFYKGWVYKKDLVIVDDDNFTYFNNPTNFIVITDSFVTIDDKILDMSTKLPLLKVESDKYLVEIPAKNDEGVFHIEEKYIEKDRASIGYLQYTKNNVYIQAFKYLNIPYSWGGKRKGVDCSGFIANLYRTFGFKFPRNSSEQMNSFGDYFISLEDLKVDDKKAELLQMDTPALLYFKNHVALYLGIYNEEEYIIHAYPDDKMIVQETKIDMSKNDKENLYERLLGVVILK